jgi:hypothetical protein
VKTIFVLGGIVLILGGLFAAWLGTPAPDDPSTPQYDPYEWDYFCFGSGLFVVILGLALLAYGIRYKEVPIYPYRAPYAPPPPPAYPPVQGTFGERTPFPESVPPASTQCRICGASNPPDARFCVHCGAPQS